MEICCSYRCAVTQHQCTAALVWAKCNPHCSELLCKTGSQHALCHCNYTFEDLLPIQVCSEPANCTAALLWANAIPTVQCCSAKQAHIMHYIIATTPVKICCSYRCAVTQHQCTAALVWAKCSPHCSVLLCKTGSKHALCHCHYTYKDLMLIQVCSESAPVHCSTGFGKMQSPLFSAALQNRLT